MKVSLTVSPFRPFLLRQPRVCSRNLRLLPSYAPRGANISPVLSTLRVLPVATGVCPNPLRSSRHALTSVSPSRCLPRPGRSGKSHVLSSLPPLCRSLRSFSRSLPLFSIACSLFYKNTRGGYPQKSPLLESVRCGLFFPDLSATQLSSRRLCLRGDRICSFTRSDVGFLLLCFPYGVPYRQDSL